MKQQLRINSLDELRARQEILKAEQQMLAAAIVNESKAAVIGLPMVALNKPADPLRVLKIDGKSILQQSFSPTFYRLSSTVPYSDVPASSPK